MKLKIFFGAVLAVLMSTNVTLLTFAASAPAETAGIFSFEESETEENTTMRMGQNLFLFGDNLEDDSRINGLLFAFSNQATLADQSDYGFVAGNIITYKGKTAKDLFVAGNSITISENAEIGRDAFVAGNSVVVETDLPSNLAVAASRVELRDIKIAGDVDLSVGHVIFSGQVEIAGKLIINSDADVTGWGNLTYNEIEKYEVQEYQPTVTEILIAKLISIVGLFVTMAIVLAMFPGANQKVAKQLSMEGFGKNLLVGICTLVAVPVISLFLIMSFVGAPAGIILLVAYIVLLYLAQGFSGLYIGKAILEKGFGHEMNRFLEMLLGIVIIGFLTLLPSVGGLIMMLSLSLGFGLFMQCINPRSKNRTPAAPKAQKTSTKTTTRKTIAAEVIESGGAAETEDKKPVADAPKSSKKSKTDTEVTEEE